jgi:hypothetical protein
MKCCFIHTISTIYSIKGTLFTELIAVYFDNYMKHINVLCRKNSQFPSLYSKGYSAVRSLAVILLHVSLASYIVSKHRTSPTDYNFTSWKFI